MSALLACCYEQYTALYWPLLNYKCANLKKPNTTIWLERKIDKYLKPCGTW